MTRVCKTQHGFTLLELVVVVAVLGLITSLVTELLVLNANQQRFEETKKRRVVIRDAIHRYFQHCNEEFPGSLKALVVDPGAAECSEWKGPYLLDVNFESGTPVYRDAWGNVNSVSSVDASNYGWLYNKDGAASTAVVTLQTVGLDGASGAVASPGSPEEEYETDYPPDSSFPLTTYNAASFAVAFPPVVYALTTASSAIAAAGELP